MSDFSIITPRIRLSLCTSNDDAELDAMFGRGVAQLCRGVQTSGSLNRAAKEMGMAYSKAWRIVKHTEETFGVQLLNRNGAHGSTLTEEGVILLDSYERLEAEIIAFAREKLPEIIEEYSR